MVGNGVFRSCRNNHNVSEESKFVLQSSTEKGRISAILNTLAEQYPDAKCALNFRNAFELLVATILSAQCTDKRVNEITARLFTEVKGPGDIVELGVDGLAERIRGLGLFRNKSKHLYEAAVILLEQYDGKVPESREALMKLPGVGRKTANVVLANAFGQPTIAVDTHVQRVANRLGLAHSDDPEGTERQLMEVVSQELWIDTHHRLIQHGRALCKARRPLCEKCPLLPYCPAGRLPSE